MSSVESAVQPSSEPPTEELRVADWLGIARYLGAAVERDTLTIDLAREELRGSMFDAADEKALRRAVSIAEDEEPTGVVSILRGAADAPPPVPRSTDNYARTTEARGRERVADRLRARATEVAQRFGRARRAATSQR